MKQYYVIAGAIAMLSTTAGMIYFATRNDHFKNAPTEIAGCKDPAVTAVIHSIRNYPNSWETDNYQMWHDEDVSIWTANEDYGLSLTMGSSNASPDHYAMDDQCRAVLYDTTQTWLRNTLNEKLRG